MAHGNTDGGTGPVTVLQRAVNVGTLVKTLIGFMAALITASVAVYDHFAKTSELRKLQCQVKYQTAINNHVLKASAEIKTALSALKQSLDTPKTQPGTTKVLTEQISVTIGNIGSSLSKVDDVREKANDECDTTGTKK